jgi:hypothetical protein
MDRFSKFIFVADEHAIIKFVHVRLNRNETYNYIKLAHKLEDEMRLSIERELIRNRARA